MLHLLIIFFSPYDQYNVPTCPHYFNDTFMPLFPFLVFNFCVIFAKLHTHLNMIQSHDLGFFIKLSFSPIKYQSYYMLLKYINIRHSLLKVLVWNWKTTHWILSTKINSTNWMCGSFNWVIIIAIHCCFLWCGSGRLLLILIISIIIFKSFLGDGGWLCGTLLSSWPKGSKFDPSS